MTVPGSPPQPMGETPAAPATPSQFWPAYGQQPPPSVAATILVTFFFGLFGLIPAVRGSKRARQAGQPGDRYWIAFGATLLASFVLYGLVVFLTLTLVLNAASGSAAAVPAAGARPGNPAAAGAAPQPLSPADGSVFSFYPRTTTLQWTSVPGATGYKVEVDYAEPAGTKWYLEERWESGTPATQWTFGFVGAQPGRWRVQAVFPSGDGPPSAWWGFRYTR